MAGPFYDPTGTVSGNDDGVAGPEPANDQKPTAPAQVLSLGLDDAAAMLARIHGTAVDKHDPLLMLVTLQQRFVGDLQGLLGAHDKAIEAAIRSTASTTAKAVDASLELLKDKTVRAGIDSALALAERQGKAIEQNLQTIRRLRLGLSALSAVNWLAVAISLGLLWSILR